jgi:hypothetical protein
MRQNRKSPEVIEANAEAASRKARAGGYRGPVDETVSGKIKLAGGQIHYQGRQYPAKGARAVVGPDVRSGLAGRRHTTEITVTLATGGQLVSSRTAAGRMARVVRQQSTAFAAAVNTAG